MTEIIREACVSRRRLARVSWRQGVRAIGLASEKHRRLKFPRHAGHLRARTRVWSTESKKWSSRRARTRRLRVDSGRFLQLQVRAPKNGRRASCPLGQTMFFYDPPDCLENLGAERAENSSKPGTGRFKKSIAAIALGAPEVRKTGRLQPPKRLSWLPGNGGYNEKRHAEACPTPECAP